MKHVAVIVNTLRYGGAEIQTVELVNGLTGKGYDITLFSLDSGNDILYRLNDKVKVIFLDKKRFLDLRSAKRLICSLRAIKPYCIIMTNPYSTLYGYLCSYFLPFDSKMISVQHTTTVTGIKEKIKLYFESRIINRMNKVIFVSDNQMEYWRLKYNINPFKSEVIYNGIDVSRFRDFSIDSESFRKLLGFDGKDIVIGVIAGLRPEKKHEDLIEAGCILKNEGYPLKLLFIGDGNRRRFLEVYAKSRNMQNSVVFTGFVKDVRPYLASLDISAITSIAVETLSLAAIESMAMGKPMVMSDIGGACELIDNGINGFLYPAGDIRALVETIKTIFKKDLFSPMGRASLAKAESVFGKEQMIEKYTAAIES